MPRKPRGWKEEDEGFSSWVKTSSTSEAREQYKLQRTQTNIDSSSQLQSAQNNIEPIEIQSPDDNLSSNNIGVALPLEYDPVFNDPLPRKTIVGPIQLR